MIQSKICWWHCNFYLRLLRGVGGRDLELAERPRGGGWVFRALRRRAAAVRWRHRLGSGCFSGDLRVRWRISRALSRSLPSSPPMTDLFQNGLLFPSLDRAILGPFYRRPKGGWDVVALKAHSTKIFGLPQVIIKKKPFIFTNHLKSMARLKKKTERLVKKTEWFISKKSRVNGYIPIKSRVNSKLF
jgi:hypothetical protein